MVAKDGKHRLILNLDTALWDEERFFCLIARMKESLTCQIARSALAGPPASWRHYWLTQSEV